MYSCFILGCGNRCIFWSLIFWFKWNLIKNFFKGIDDYYNVYSIYGLGYGC